MDTYAGSTSRKDSKARCCPDPACTPDSPVLPTGRSGAAPDSPVSCIGPSGDDQGAFNCNFLSDFFVIEEFRDMDKLGQGFTSADPSEQGDIGNGIIPRPTFVNKTLKSDSRNKLIGLLKEYAGCFAWSYTEMSGLSRDLVEHWLPIKPGFQSYKQKPRPFGPDIYPHIKHEIHWLLEANFIRTCRYADWVSNIVPVEKKGTDKLRVCIDFHNLNKATPKNEYPMPIADILINNASSHKVISFLDGNAGHNQIFMAEEDVSKTAFDVLVLLVYLSGL
jgi:hypothetical protein